MRRIICLFCVIALLSCGPTAAMAGPKSDKPVKNDNAVTAQINNSLIEDVSATQDKATTIRQTIKDKVNQRQQAKQQIASQLKLIKQNQVKALKLKKILNVRNREIQNELKVLRQKDNSISKEQLKLIKTRLNLVKEDGKAITSINSNINTELKRLKIFEKTGSLQNIQNVLDTIASLQQRQQTIFQKAIADLEELHEALL